MYCNAVIYTQTKYKNLNTNTYKAVQVWKLMRFLIIFVAKFKAKQESENCEKITEGNGSLYVKPNLGGNFTPTSCWISLYNSKTVKTVILAICSIQ